MAALATSWDAIVVGAGPAGAVAARELARRGRSVLLVDKCKFPRDKVCGGCLSGAALATLEAVGLGDLPARLGGVPTRQFELHAGGRTITLPLSSGVAVSRRSLDAALVEAAVAEGATFLDHTAASCDGVSEEWRYVRLHGERHSSRIVLAADGLGGTLLRGEKAHAVRIGRGAYMGVFATAEAMDERWRGTIRMHCGRGGYVGMTHVEGGRIQIAAALSPGLVRDCGGPGEAASAIVGDSLPTVDAGGWTGVGLLTRRRRRMADQRLFIVGDAAGYVEPFTGEGMAWAMGSAMAAAGIAEAAIEGWRDDLMMQWDRVYRQVVGRRQGWCRAVTAMLRYPMLTGWCVRLLEHRPGLARPVLNQLSQPMTQQETAA